MSNNDLSIILGITIGILMGFIPFVRNFQDKITSYIKRIIIKL
jgi:ABC-type nitrate/sulfonate/bicarbonate transport system permease component